MRLNCNENKMNLQSVKKSFRDFLHEKGLRYTPEREEIVEEVFSNDRHFDADELYLKMKMKNRNVSRATVYRCLNLLEECDFVVKTRFGERHSHYENIVNRTHHDHLICTKCGRIVEFCDDIIEQRQREVCRKHDYELHNHKLQIFGLCPHCRGDSGTKGVRGK